jgi:hypothetical protein
MDEVEYVFFDDLDKKKEEGREPVNLQIHDIFTIIYNMFFSTGLDINKEKAT